jgi:hypothetical protein
VKADDIVTLSQNVKVGDNYRVVAGPVRLTLIKVDPVVIAPDGTAETKGRLFLDLNNDKQVQANEILDETNRLQDMATSPLLTIWKRLNVEVDSMGAPEQFVIFAPDDLLRGDVEDPDVSKLSDALRKAYIEVRVDTEHSDKNLPFVYQFGTFNGNLPIEVQQNTVPYYIFQNTGGNRRQRAMFHQVSDQLFWTSYLLGAYERLTDGRSDNDPDMIAQGGAQDGRVIIAETGTLQNKAFSAIFNEVLRDVGDMQGQGYRWTGEQSTRVKQWLTVQSIGTQFFLRLDESAAPTHAMVNYDSTLDANSYSQFPNVPLQYKPADIKLLRQTIAPKGTETQRIQ